MQPGQKKTGIDQSVCYKINIVMTKRLIAFSFLILLLASNCSDDKVTQPSVGTLYGKVTLDSVGVSGVVITISPYDISSKRNHPKMQSFNMVSEAGEFLFELYPGTYRADFLYYGGNDEVFQAARYPLYIIANKQTNISVELKDPVPRCFLASDGDAAVELSWESSYDAIYYLLYRSTSMEESFQIISRVDTSYGTIYHSDQPQSVGTYYYRATSVNSQGQESDFDTTLQIDFTATIYPPTGFQAIDMVDYVHLSWDSKPCASYYRLHRSEDNDQNWAFIDSTAENYFYDIPSDTSIYYYRLTAVSIYGTESEPSASVIVNYDGRFDPPRNVSIVDRGSDLHLSWLGYSNVAYYSIYRATSPEDNYFHIDSTNHSYYSDIPPVEGTYYYYVTAIGPNGLESDPSSVVSADFDGVLDYPAGVTATNKGLHVELNWEEVYWAGYYVIYRSEDDSRYQQVGRVSGSVTTFNDTPPSAGLYYYGVSTETVAGDEGEMSEPVTVQFTDNLLAPVDVVTENMGTYIRVMWNAVAGANGYNIYRAPEGGGYIIIGSAEASYYNDIPPEEGSYFYKVRATDELGHISPYSSPAYAYYYARPLPPYDVTAIDSVYNVHIGWQSEDTLGYYIIYRSFWIDGEYDSISYSQEKSFIHWPDAGREIFYKIRAVAPNDSLSDLSDFAHVYFTGFLEPPAITDAYQHPDSDFVRLNWTAPAGASYYDVHRKLNIEDDYQFIVGVEVTTAIDRPDSAGIYDYKVKAFTVGDLESGFSAPVQVEFEP